MLAKPKQPKKPANPQLNRPLSLNPGSLGTKRKVVGIAAQGAREFHAVSNPFNYQRADALILYGRSAVVTHNAVAPKLFREIGARAVSGYEVLDPGVVLVVFGLGTVGQHDRSACEP